MSTVTPIPKAKKRKTTKKQSVGKQCDLLFSKIVRSVGKCEIDDGRPCKGWLECAHGFSRSYRAVRWDRRNAFCACVGHHKFYTHRPLEWDLWMRERMGEELYEEIRALALAGERPDTQALLVELKAEARAA